MAAEATHEPPRCRVHNHHCGLSRPLGRGDPTCAACNAIRTWDKSVVHGQASRGVAVARSEGIGMYAKGPHTASQASRPAERSSGQSHLGDMGPPAQRSRGSRAPPPKATSRQGNQADSRRATAPR
eukprot:6892173-Heterocapsa_arctica.AAC.1